MSNNSAEQYEVLVKKSFDTLARTYFAHFGLLTTGALAMVTNTIILVMAVRFPMFRQGAYIMITQLGVADFLTGVAYVATGLKRIIRYYGRIPEVASQVHCSGEMFLAYFGQASSITIALTMAVERTLATLWPMTYKAKQEQLYPILTIIGWTWAIIDAGFMFYGTSSSKLIPNCNLVSSVSQGFYNFQNVHKQVQVASITLLYLAIVIKLWLRVREAKKSDKNVKKIRKELGVKVAKMVVAVGLMYVVTQILARGGLALLTSFAPHVRANYAPFIRMIMILNSGLNLFIYLGLNNEYRSHFFGFFSGNKVVPTSTRRENPNEKQGRDRNPAKPPTSGENKQSTS